MDDALIALENMLDNTKVSDEVRNEIIGTAYKVRDSFIYYLDKVPIESLNLKSAVNHLAGRGKFVRGVFTYLFSKSLGIGEEEATILAVATELYHLASLIHDDIIDSANFRRGVETVHRKFGVEYAIIAGDLLIVYGNYLLSTLGCDVIKIYAFQGVKLSDGEAIELDMGVVRDIDKYYKLVDLKTGSVFKAMLESSVVLSGLDRLKGYAIELGREIGYAFQMSDDVLDVVGQPIFTGKGVGMDVDGPNIVNIFLMEGYPLNVAIDKTRELIRSHIDRALDILSKFDLDKNYMDVLSGLISSLEVRKS